MQETTIQLYIQEESKLYSPYDPSREKLNDEVYKYLKSFCIDRINTVTQFDKIQIISDAPIDGDRFRENLRKAVKTDQEALDWQLEVNNKRAVWEYIVGIGLSVLGFILSIYLDKVLLGVVSFFGSLVLREAVQIGTKVNPDIKHDKNRLTPLAASEVEVILNTGK